MCVYDYKWMGACVYIDICIVLDFHDVQSCIFLFHVNSASIQVLTVIIQANKLKLIIL